MKILKILNLNCDQAEIIPRKIISSRTIQQIHTTFFHGWLSIDLLAQLIKNFGWSGCVFIAETHHSGIFYISIRNL